MTKKQQTGLVGLCALLYFTSYFTRKNFAAVMVELISLELLDKEAAGLVVSALFITYGAGQIISGLLGDKISPSLLICSGLVMTALCNLAMPFAVGIPVLAVGIWAINGLAQAFFWPPLVRLLSENLTHEGFVRANVVVTAAAHSATIMIFLFTAFCLSFVDWRTAFFGPAVLAVVVLVLWIFAMRLLQPKHGAVQEEKVVQEPPAAKAMPMQQFMPLLLSAGLVPVLLVIVLQGYLRDGIDAWLPTLFSEVFDKGAATSVLVSVILPIFAILAVYLTGFLHRRILKNEVAGALFFFAVSALFSLTLLLSMHWNSSVASLISISLFSACMHAMNMLLISCLPSRFARHGRAATASGICNAATYIGSAVASYGIALMAEKLGWETTVLSWLLIVLCGLVACLLALRPYSRFLHQKND